MQLKVKTAGIFLGASKTDYVRKSDNKPGCYYNVALKQGGEVGNIPCNEDIYKQYESGQLMLWRYSMTSMDGCKSLQ